MSAKTATPAPPTLTAERLLARTPRTRTVEVPLGPDEGDVVTLTLRELSRREYDELVSAHPAKGKQPKGWPYDPDTFGPALIAAALVEPAMTVEQARQLYDEWPPGDVAAVFFAAQELATKTSVRAVGNGSGPTAA